MQVANLNPITWAKKGLGKGLDSLTADRQSAQPPATIPDPNTPASTTGNDGTIYANAEPVTGRFVPTGQSTTSSLAATRTEQFARVVATFDEDKLHLLAHIVSKFFTGLAYLAPLLIGYFAGAALGDTISGTFNFGAGSFNVFTHLISIVMELSIPMLGYAVAVTFRRAAKDRGQLAICAILSILFLLLAVGNAITQDILLYHALPQITSAEKVSVWFRSFGPSIIDVLATIFISVVGVRNLRKYLADQREKIHATREVNLIHIEMDKTTLQADIDRQSAIMDMESKKHRSETWNTIEAMQSQAMIEQAKRNMIDGPDSGSSRLSRNMVDVDGNSKLANPLAILAAIAYTHS